MAKNIQVTDKGTHVVRLGVRWVSHQRNTQRHTQRGIHREAHSKDN